MADDIKRLFFALRVVSEWHDESFADRIIKPEYRHITLSFLGNIASERLFENISLIPLPEFVLSPCGLLDTCLFLPKHRPHVVSYHANFFEQTLAIQAYKNHLNNWLKDHCHIELKNGFEDWLPHVSLGRGKFIPKLWKKDFFQRCFICPSLHLYESMGANTFAPLWTHSFITAFEEKSHEADIAFLVRGKNIQEIYRHAQFAIGTKFPEFSHFFDFSQRVNNFEEMIIALNELVTRQDISEGTNIKAISFHGHIEAISRALYQWEMIIDV